MKQPPSIKTIGILILLFWGSFTPYLYPTPFQPNPKLEEFAESMVNVPQELKKYGGIENKTKEDIVNDMQRSILWQWSKFLTLIIMGSITGIIALKSYKNTPIPNSIFYTILFAYYIWGKLHITSTERFLNTHLIMLKGMPVKFIHHEILYPLVCIFLAIYFFKIIKKGTQPIEA